MMDFNHSKRINNKMNNIKITQEIGDDTTIEYIPNFLSEDKSKSLFDYLKLNALWRQDTFTTPKGSVLVPRLTAFYASKGTIYKYAGLTQESDGMDPKLEDIVNSVSIASDIDFNSILINYYRDEKDSIGLHSDSERELGFNPIVSALSLGGVRKFDLVSNKDKKNVVSFNLENGSLIVMGRNCQKNWRHKIDKYTGNESRISLTFRKIFNEGS